MDSTKYKLADAAKRLMETTSLSRMTVTDIVDEAGLTRQTFYRNFKDKYALVNWYFDKLAGQSFKEMGVHRTLRDSLILKFNFIQNEKVFFKQAFKSTDYNSVVQYDYNYILNFYTDMIAHKTGKVLSPEITFILKLYCHGSIAMTVEWSNQGMKESSESMADNLIHALPRDLEKLLCDVL